MKHNPAKTGLGGEQNMLETRSCQFLIKLGFRKYATDTINDTDDGVENDQTNQSDRKSNKAWFEGMAVGLHEAGVIDDDDLEELINDIKEI